MQRNSKEVRSNLKVQNNSRYRKAHARPRRNPREKQGKKRYKIGLKARAKEVEGALKYEPKANPKNAELLISHKSKLTLK